jgi:hypothetical protein
MLGNMRRATAGLALLLLAGCGSSAGEQRSHRINHRSTAVRAAATRTAPVVAHGCGVDRLFAANARAQVSADPNSVIGRLSADGTAMGVDPKRFAVFATPIASRLERTQVSFIRSLRRASPEVSRSYATGEFAALVVLERRVMHDLHAVVAALRRLRRVLSSDVAVADAVQLYGIDARAAEETANGFGIRGASAAGFSPGCSVRHS